MKDEFGLLLSFSALQTGLKRGDMEAMQDIWPTRRRPRSLETQEDQFHPDTSLLQEFKAALISQESTGTAPDFFSGAPDDLVAKLQGHRSEVCDILNR